LRLSVTERPVVARSAHLLQAIMNASRMARWREVQLAARSKEKAGGHLRRRPCLATAGEVERRRNYAKAIVNPMTIRVCTPPITGPGLCFLPPDGHGHERLSESASRNLARSRPGGISSSQRFSNMNLFEPLRPRGMCRSRNHGLPAFCHPDWCRSDTISKFRFEIWNPQNVRRCRSGHRAVLQNVQQVLPVHSAYPQNGSHMAYFPSASPKRNHPQRIS